MKRWLVILFMLLPTVAFGQQIDGKFVNGSTITGLNASNISSGTLAAARGGAGTINGVLAGNGAGVVSQGTCAGLSGVAASCSTDTTQPANIIVYSQVGSGNSTYGNNTSFAANSMLANEQFPVQGKIIHLSVFNITGGTCTTAPKFNSYVVHGGVETDGTALSGSTTANTITGGPSNQVQNQTFVANDQIGIKIDSTSSPSGCNAPSFDADILVCLGSGC